MNMSIAIFHTGFATLGGAEVLAARQAQYLRGHGVDITVFSFSGLGTGIRPLLEGSPYVELKKRHWTDVISFWSKAKKIRARSRRAAVHLREFETVIAHNAPCTTMLGLAEGSMRRLWYCHEPPRSLYLEACNPNLTRRSRGAELAGEPEAVKAFRAMLQKTDHWGPQQRLRHRSLVRLDQEGASAFLSARANSAFCMGLAKSVYPGLPVDVMYPMVTFEREPLRRLGLDRSGLQVLAHSRLEVMKNLDTVIRGFAKFQEHHPGAVLHIVGEGKDKPRLQAVAQACLPAGAFRFHGFLQQTELDAVYARCDVAAMLPLDEPFGMVFPEAAGRGLLLIGPDHGGPLEILEGGEIGWTCDPFDPEVMADALNQIWALSDEDVRRRRERAYQSCLSRFSPEVIGEQLMQWIR